MRTMYDSVTATDIPTSAAMVAGYAAADPSFAWSPADWARFPNAVKVVIATRASVTGLGIHVLDVETGDATPAEAPGWANTQRALGQIPSVYCNASTWPSVQSAFTTAAVDQPYYWIAAYPGGGPVIPAGAIAHQYADPGTSGGHYDLSVVADYWPGVDPATPGSEPMGMTAGTFEYGVPRHTIPFTVGASSVTQAQAWLRLRTAWGAVTGVQVVFEDDAGDNLGTVNIDSLYNNTSDPIEAPSGTTGVNVGWTGEQPLSGIDHPSVGWSIEYVTK